MLKIKILDSIECQVIDGEELIFPVISYQDESYRQVQWGGKRVSKRKSLLHHYKTKTCFPTGLLNRIQKYCSKNNIPLEIDDPEEILIPLLTNSEPFIQGKNLKDGKWSYQYKLIQSAILYQRGVIKAATGSGKTSIMLGFISCYPFSRVLFLCNTHVPITQFKEALINSGLKNSIDIFTIQSFYRKKPKEYIDKYDIIIIDECHDGLRSSKSMYGKMLRNCLAPIRLGFTATLPDNEADRLNLEGLLGPVIGELTIQEGIERQVLSKPKIIIKKLPDNSSLKEYRKYHEAYCNCVVNNRALNRQIIIDALEDASECNGSVLILVTEIEHGQNIIDLAKNIYRKEFIFVHGSTDKEERERIRKQMINGDVNVVIATAVFKKALDVPNLTSVILGFGGKSDTQTIQAIGRGTRNVDGAKDRVIIRDYFIPSNLHMIKHFSYRLCLYMDQQWL